MGFIILIFVSLLFIKQVCLFVDSLREEGRKELNRQAREAEQAKELLNDRYKIVPTSNSSLSYSDSDQSDSEKEANKQNLDYQI